MGNKISNIPFQDLTVYPIEDTTLTSLDGRGSNQKNILIVLPKEEDTLDNIKLLEKILKSVDLSLESDSFICHLTGDKNISFSKLNNENAFKVVLLFGYPPKKLGLNFEILPYHPIEHFSVNYLYVNTLTEISDNRNYKGGLWNALKEIYNIK